MKDFEESFRAQKASLKNWLDRDFPLLLVFFTVIALVVVIRSFRLPETGRPVVVGCVMAGEMEGGSWNESHYNALFHTCRKHGCRMVVRNDVPPTAEGVSAAVEGLVREGCNVIFLTRFSYAPFMDEIAKSYPRVAFFKISGKGTARNCTAYFARLYQARYLAGIVAGSESRTGVLGYVAAVPEPQIYRDINAYALGMRSANPKARLIVRFTGSWDDEEEERASVALLEAEGADVITYHQDKPYAVREAEDRGLFSIGYNAVKETYSERFLTATVYDLDVLYEKVLSDYLAGRTNFSRIYWLGWADKAVRLHPMSPAVRRKTLFAVDEATRRIMTDWDVFSGIIYDNEGVLRCERDERISDAELFEGMDWLVEGVELYE
ncbi:MAG: BMP family ABC transporter substrate-binding protein [Schwartzia sp.]|nr:BMP family ABC transporter substrate-binding protein [Schwartzia sp. (in: firmicutes)]